MANAAKLEKEKIDQAIRHATMMHRKGHLSDREMQQFTKRVIAHALEHALEEDEYDGMVSSGQFDKLRKMSAYDDDEDPDVAESGRNAVVTKVVANFLSDPMIRHALGNAEIEHLKEHGLHPGDVEDHEMDQHLDDVYFRSTEPDSKMFDEDTETNAALEQIAAGNYGERRAPQAESSGVVGMPDSHSRRSSLDDLLKDL